MPIDLEKIGGFLKEKRESKGLTLADVSNKLYIRKSLINALESGNWQLLPHEIYVRGYLKEYANLLNVYSEIADDLKQQGESTVPPEIPIQQKTESKHRRIPKRAFIYPLSFVLIVGFFILSQLNRHEPVAPTHPTELASKNIIDDVTTDNTPTVVEASTVKKLMITCQERTWVSVVIDDIEKKEFMLNPQDIIILNAKATYDLLIGNAGGVRLILDGKDVQFSGMSGEVKRIRLS